MLGNALTMNDTGRKRPLCTNWCKNTWRSSLHRLKRKPDQGYPVLSKTNSMHFLNVAFWDAVLAPLQSTACTYRIALDRRAGQKVLTLKTAPTQNVQPLPDKKYCVNAHGFSLHAGVRCAMNQRKELEHLCRYITRPTPRILSCRRWNLCSDWPPWFRGQD